MRIAPAVVVALALAGCPTRNTPPPDGAAADAGRDAPALDVPGLDASDPADTSLMDAPLPLDAPLASDAPFGLDAEAPPDAPAPVDAPMPADAPRPLDAPATVDAPPPPGCDEQLAALRVAVPGAVTLPVSGATVTYVRPSIGADPAGFFVQCAAAGPAVFVAVDPSGLAPSPAPGDRVSFTATSVADAPGTSGTGDQDRVTALSSFVRDATGVALAPLVQDLSSRTDVVSALEGYESELVQITGTIESAFVFSGTGHRRAPLTTAGVMSAQLVVRVPDPLVAALGLRVGCEITVGPSPLWRFDATAQAMGYTASDITVLSCPPLPAPPVGGVVVTELGYAFAGADDGLEFVELFNPSTTDAYGLGGCTLTDAGANILTFGAALAILPGARLVVGGAMSETGAAVELPATFGLGTDDALTLACGTAVVDVVDWGAAPFPGATDDVSMQLAPGASTAAGNDDGSNWCLTPMGTTYGASARRGSPGLVNPACPAASCPAATHLVINELDYDMPGSDTTEFVEIFNPTSATVDLTGFALVFVNGSTDTEAGRASLSGTLMPGAYLVVRTSSSASLVVPSGVATATLSSSLQNDDEAVVLLGPDGVVDCVAYEGTVPTATIGGALLTLTECGTSAGAESADGSLARRPNACDRDTPAMDWAVAASPSVGVANP